MENKILSLDLGSNSIGATIRDLTDSENQFYNTTVITFETGVGKDDKGKYTLSHSAQRTSKRSLRRLYQSKKYKLMATLKVLGYEKKYCPIEESSLKRWKNYNKEEAIKGNGGRAYPINDIFFNNWIKLDFDNDGTPDYTSPYELRAELNTLPLDFENEVNRFKLGRALYHIAQHRGFKSSKKMQSQDEDTTEHQNEDYSKDKGAENKKRSNFWLEIDKLNIGIDHNITVGEAFNAVLISNRENNTNLRVRSELHQYVTRKMLMQEVEAIFQFQHLDFGSIFKDANGRPLKISQSPMFWQRPLRSQKGTIGKCTFEPNKFRSSTSHPEYEEFQAWSFLNNIQYRLRDDKEAKPKQIPLEYRQELFNDKFFRVTKKDFLFKEITDWVKTKNQHDDWELNYSNKTNVTACPVSARLKSIFGDNWIQYQCVPTKTRQQKKNDGSIRETPVTYNIYDIWHILFESDDEDFVEGFATSTLNLAEKQTNQFLALYHAMPVGYGMLSLKAIRSILPFLRYGLKYTDATLLAKVPTILGDSVWEFNKDVILENLQTEVIDKNRDEKRGLNIVNDLIAKYKALPGNEQFAKNMNYRLYERDTLLGLDSKERDAYQIIDAIEANFGKKTWEKLPETERQETIKTVAESYQSFFADRDRKFKKLPPLQLAMKHYLADNFGELKCPNTFKELKDSEPPCSCLACKKLNSLYHPSQISIYPPAKEEFYEYGSIKKCMVMLGTPYTGAFKNPMAMRALHELKKFINYLIATEQIDEQTRIVLEIPRDSNLDDNNRRWAWAEYQNRREAENKEFREAIYSLLKDPDGKDAKANPDNASDIDKFRLWYEMLQGEDTKEGFLKDRRFLPLIKTTFSKKNRKGQEEDFEEFNEDNYLKINRSLYFKLQQAKDNIQEKYRLWKQQECRCIYTNRMIKITDLFQEDIVDFEHTIPRSRSLDNSLANRTVAYKDFNRNIKKNKIPYELDNYDKPAYDYDGSILQRIEKWEQKVKDIELHLEYWKTQSKRASRSKLISPTSNISEKDYAIRQKHLWEFDLKYWRDKVSRFKITEITSGFRKSQLVDTQIISKYALHYLKTFFHTVDIQKGANTSEFRKIFGIQQIGTQKDRNLHSHHAKDAIILSVIPSSQLREQILSIWYEIQEQQELLLSETEVDKRTIVDGIGLLRNKLSNLIRQCNLPKNLNHIIEKLDDHIFINNITKDQILTPAKKRLRSRGKIARLKDNNGNVIFQTDENGDKIQRSFKDGNPVWKTNDHGNTILDENGNKIPIYLYKEKWATGISIRGQLHKESFYGAIRLRKKDHDGNFLRNDVGDYEFEDVRHVIRKELVFKSNDQSVGFKNLNEIESVIVDRALFKIIRNQVEDVGDFKQALQQGVWMKDRNGYRVNQIRRIRCFVTPKGEINVKKHTCLSKHSHKQYIISENAETPYYGLYKSKNGTYRHECLTLWEISKIRSIEDTSVIEELFPKLPDHELTVLSKGTKLLLLKDTNESYRQLSSDNLSKRLYYITKFYKKEGYIQMQYHIDARDNNSLKKDFPKEIWGEKGINGFSEPDFETPKHKLLLSKKNFCFLIEGKHFELTIDGKIKWH